METTPDFNEEAGKRAPGPNTMSSDFVQKLVDNYRNNQLGVINTKLEMEDAHSICFDLATLKKFISDIENEVQKVDTTITVNNLGVRFYYAAYPELKNWDIMENTAIEKTYAGKHTLVMIPTLKRKSEEGELLNYDFNPLDATSYNQNNNIGEEEKVMALAKKPVGPVFSQNHGSLAPPEIQIGESF
ncbi:hypothetical protein [Chryseobacterium polytrichastri]|uniref:Uncharacterized protein n=1 Tax=Chryseobacterium polytrichastri TaxID=1302687 RepID=A0A1M7GWG0_9FLAO|nr:hypothetical protein [Chryseobacterium polytrichastri]SHM20523.1 hypothetical protein SAMN05444267_10384 [Chryseobacterium polytrichastri]